jgi:hypothetical protein
MRIFLLVLLITSAAAAQTCAPHATQQAAANALALQRQLLAASTPVMDTDVPLPLRPVLHNFKQALIATVDTELRCDHPEAVVLQSVLVSLLNANAPPRPLVPEQGPPWPTTEVGDYGGELHIEVKAVPAQPNLYSIQITYDIECGTDNILLLYRHTPSGWQRELLWQNPDLNSVGDAFGDMYLFTPVPAPEPALAVVHGAPWCSSNMSMLSIDIIALSRQSKPQRILDHVQHDYRRDYDVRLRPEADGFQLRAEVDSMDESQLMRPGILRYNTTSGKLIRRQPIASNAVGFVDGWFSAPWSEAEQWSDTTSLASLRAAHDQENAQDPLAKTSDSADFGAVRACTSERHTFQVEIDRTAYNFTDSGKPTWHPLPSLYAKLRQNPNSFTMLSITPYPDPACHGPDLMKGPSK